MNHRKYVGGDWEVAGKLQIDFLKEEGLQPYHNFLDIGCGSLRAGRYFIEFLYPRKYFGVEKHEWLVEAGLKDELTEKVRRRDPKIDINDTFNFDFIGNNSMDYAIAKSVFTHLTKEKISLCLSNLLPKMKSGGKFYASISKGLSEDNPKEDSETKRFRYTAEEIKELAAGWYVEELGNDGCIHQTMLRFTPIKKDFKVSIVTAAFRADNMDKVLKSINSQNFLGIKEWIIVNDAQECIREWYKKTKNNGMLDKIDVSFIDLEHQLGKFGLYSRNIGAMISKYDRIVFLDDDNEWEEDFISSMVESEKSTGKIPYCDIRLIGKKPGSTYNRVKRTHFGKQGIDLGCIFYRKEHFEKYGYFRNTNQTTFDYDFMLKIFNGEGRDNFISTKKSNFIFWHKRY